MRAVQSILMLAGCLPRRQTHPYAKTTDENAQHGAHARFTQSVDRHAWEKLELASEGWFYRAVWKLGPELPAAAMKYFHLTYGSYRAVAARYTALSCCGCCCNKLYSRQRIPPLPNLRQS